MPEGVKQIDQWIAKLEVIHMEIADWIPTFEEYPSDDTRDVCGIAMGNVIMAKRMLATARKRFAK